jgi:hypothetical protein
VRRLTGREKRTNDEKRGGRGGRGRCSPLSLSRCPLLLFSSFPYLHGRVDELVEGVQLLADEALVLKEGGDDGPGVLLENEKNESRLERERPGGRAHGFCCLFLSAASRSTLGASLPA